MRCTGFFFSKHVIALITVAAAIKMVTVITVVASLLGAEKAYFAH